MLPQLARIISVFFPSALCCWMASKQPVKMRRKRPKKVGEHVTADQISLPLPFISPPATAHPIQLCSRIIRHASARSLPPLHSLQASLGGD